MKHVLLFILLGSAALQACAQIVLRDPIDLTLLPFEERQSILIDGGLRDVTSGTNDKSATGLLGFRIDKMQSRFEVSFAAISNQQPIQSESISDYSRTILNPYNTQAGLAFNVSYLNRYFNKNAFVVNYLRLMYARDSLSAEDYQKLTDFLPLRLYNKDIYRFGYLLDANLSSFSWQNINKMVKGGNTISFNPYLIWSYRRYWQLAGGYVEFITGLGPSVRIISGDGPADKDFMRSVLNTDKTAFVGGQATFQLYVNNLVAKAYYSLYNSNDKIAGLTNGQFYLSVGIQAQIGPIISKRKTLRESILKGLPQNATY